MRVARTATGLFTASVLDGTTTNRNSAAVLCAGFTEFTLFLTMLSAGVGTHVIQFIPQFSLDGTTWFSYLQDIWASMYFEDTVMATVITEAYSGKVKGDRFRLRIVGTNTSSSLTFTVSASVLFRKPQRA
jgi:hypothetical protein